MQDADRALTGGGEAGELAHGREVARERGRRERRYRGRGRRRAGGGRRLLRAGTEHDRKGKRECEKGMWTLELHECRSSLFASEVARWQQERAASRRGPTGHGGDPRTPGEVVTLGASFRCISTIFRSRRNRLPLIAVATLLRPFFA